MSITNLPLMRALAAKMDYLDHRQQVLSQNIANADTPGYQSKDLSKVDFGAVLKDVASAGSIKVETTNPMHMPSPNEVQTAKDSKDRMTYEVAPDKNGVILEEQMVKASETQMDYNMVTNLMAKQVAMYKIAIGRQG